MDLSGPALIGPALHQSVVDRSVLALFLLFISSFLLLHLFVVFIYFVSLSAEKGAYSLNEYYCRILFYSIHQASTEKVIYSINGEGKI